MDTQELRQTALNLLASNFSGNRLSEPAVIQAAVTIVLSVPEVK